jgi:hypothetical protein
VTEMLEAVTIVTIMVNDDGDDASLMHTTSGSN